VRFTAAPYTESRLAHLVRNKCVGFPVVEQVVYEIHISRLELQRWHLEFAISFSKTYIWDLGLRLADSFWDHVV
jgi:hypothetical protein